MLSDKIGEVIWTPSEERVQKSNLTRYMQFARKLSRRTFTSYEELYSWSVDMPDQFWFSIWDFCSIVADNQPEILMENRNRMPGARWFPGVKLNFAENLMQHRDMYPALVFHNEKGARRMLTYRDLHEQVAGLIRALRESGIQPGDRVAAYMPNIPETVVVMLATTAVGAIFTSCSMDFGTAAALDRFGPVRPKLLFAADGYYYGGKAVSGLERVNDLQHRLDGLQRTILVPYLHPAPDLKGFRDTTLLADFYEPGPAAIEFERFPFDHPVYILYSSGTTGKPKCIMHGAGGTLLQHQKELVLHTDVRREHAIFFYTTCGWMMWNWLVSALAVGARVVLYDGSPFHPTPSVLFDIAEKERISEFGVSAKYLAAAEKHGVVPAFTHHLPALRTILSTGSPLLPQGYNYVYRDIKRDVSLASISGGTDIISCFALGNPLLPVRRGELQCRGLGMNVQVFDSAGDPVIREKGELVCTTPFPSMPVGFWDDPDGSRFHAAYFERFPNTWAHGDYAEITDRGGMIIYGRSDTLLNPGGVRIGTAEIYRQVERVESVLESLAIGQEWEGDQRIVLFVRLAEGTELDEELRDLIRVTLRNNASPRHVPAVILQVPDLPRTVSGKISEKAVSDVVHGREVVNVDALANPEALDHLRDRPELSA